MGRLVIEEAAQRADVRVTAAVDAEGAPGLGAPAAFGVVATSDLAAGMDAADVYIDFTTPVATLTAARAAADRGVAAVIGTTGLGDVERAAIETLAQRAPVVWAPNFSLGVNVLLSLAETAARALGDEVDIEVAELHHKHKRDAPSGTAIALAEALARGRGQDLATVARYQRAGDVGPRTPGEIAILSLRGGDIPGEHTAFLIGDGERIEIVHRAANRAIFAVGALRAALWVHGRAPGLYAIKDVLGL
jgi:4-hydroxy-tetrahydrodipicolinate reductase